MKDSIQLNVVGTTCEVTESDDENSINGIMLDCNVLVYTPSYPTLSPSHSLYLCNFDSIEQNNFPINKTVDCI